MVWLKQRRAQKAAQHWHRAILHKAREPAPYRAGLVPDTLEGRFHMVVLAATTVLRRLRQEGTEGLALANCLNDELFSGFDHAMREQGVGDSSIARKIRKMGEDFFGLAGALDIALDGPNPRDEAAAVIVRNAVANPAQDAELAGILLDWGRELANVDSKQVLTGQGVWQAAP